MEMGEQLYLESLKSAPGRSVFHYQQEAHNITRGGISTGEEKRTFTPSNDLFTIKDLLGLEKTQLKIYFNRKSYLPCFISTSSSQMNYPSCCFDFFLPTNSVFEGSAMEMQLHCSFMSSLQSHIIIKYIKIQVENFHLIM